MNEYDIDDTRAMLVQFESISGEEYPNLRAGAETLERLRRWTNSHSDGWMYWRKPSQAAARLIGHFDGLQARYIRDELVDITEDELAWSYQPIKAFLTRQKADHEAVFPTPPSEEQLRWDALHELVHDAASQIASDALNSGEGEQFLLSNGWTQEQIDEHLARRMENA
jgi:hypothetical protein